MTKAIFFIFSVWLCTSHAFPVFLRNYFYKNGLLSFDIDNPQYIKERWYEQTRDHFSTEESKITWKQRYWINDTFWDKHNGPVFLFVGGEAEASANWLIDGQMMTLAKKYNGFAIVIEHRYVPCLTIYTHITLCTTLGLAYVAMTTSYLCSFVQDIYIHVHA